MRTKQQVYTAISTFYMLVAILSLTLVERHQSISILTLVGFYGAYCYGTLADEYRYKLQLELYEGTGND